MEPLMLSLQQPTYGLNLPQVLPKDEDDDEAFLISTVNWIEGILQDKDDVDLVHIFTHAGNDAEAEANLGKFSNRGGYKSILRRLHAINDFVDNVIMLDVPPGRASYDFETNLTRLFAEKYPHIRDADLGNNEIVMVTRPHGKGTFTPGTRVYVSLGQGLFF
jgi:hypothetical protein